MKKLAMLLLLATSACGPTDPPAPGDACAVEELGQRATGVGGTSLMCWLTTSRWTPMQWVKL